MRTIELLVMPGEIVYRVWPCGKNGYSVAEFVVSHINIDGYPHVEYDLERVVKSWKRTRAVYHVTASDFGKDVFLTEAEAKSEADERTAAKFK